MSAGTIVLILVVVVAVIATILGNRKKKWFKLYLANNDVLRVYRRMTDWWFGDSNAIMGFHLEDGRSMKVSKHWIIKVEEEQEVK
jgi:hypothetical protein